MFFFGLSLQSPSSTGGRGSGGSVEVLIGWAAELCMFLWAGLLDLSEAKDT